MAINYSCHFDISQFLPVEFVTIRGHKMVKLIDVNSMDLSLGFFKDTLSRCNIYKNIRLLPVDFWLGCVITHSFSNKRHITPSFISHVSRCGSTLLCQNLKASQKFVVLGEPSFLHDIYGKRSGNYVPKLQTEIAKCCFKVWSNWAEKNGKKLVIKVSSSLNSFVYKIMNDFPYSHWLCLVREPVAVIESLCRHPPGHLLQQKYKKEALINLAIKAYVNNIDRFAKWQNNKVIIVDYSHISVKYNDIIDFFNPALDEFKYEWQDRVSAKNQGIKPIPYVPISEKQYKHFYELNKELLGSVLISYGKLLSTLSGE